MNQTGVRSTGCRRQARRNRWSESLSASASIQGNKGNKGARKAPEKDGEVGLSGGGVSSSSEKSSSTTTKKSTVKAKGKVTETSEAPK